MNYMASITRPSASHRLDTEAHSKYTMILYIAVDVCISPVLVQSPQPNTEYLEAEEGCQKLFPQET